MMNKKTENDYVVDLFASGRGFIQWSNNAESNIEEKIITAKQPNKIENSSLLTNKDMKIEKISGEKVKSLRLLLDDKNDAVRESKGD